MNVLVISDTHNRHNKFDFTDTDNVDVIVHCGDFSHSEEQVKKFCNWFSKLDFKHKILIAGNHDEYVERIGYEQFFDYCKDKGIIYLEDTSITIDDVKFHGSPWSVTYGDWAFMMEDEHLKYKWDLIPTDVQVLITHTPPYKIGDSVEGYQDIFDTNVGSKTLRDKLEHLYNITHHFVGHIHEDYGVHYDNGYTTFNASSFNFYLKEINDYKVFSV